MRYTLTRSNSSTAHQEVEGFVRFSDAQRNELAVREEAGSLMEQAGELRKVLESIVQMIVKQHTKQLLAYFKFEV